MSDLWQYFKKMFKASENSSPNEPFIHEVIERSQEEIANYIDIPGVKSLRLLKQPGSGWEFCVVMNDGTIRIEVSDMNIRELQAFMRGIIWHMQILQK